MFDLPRSMHNRPMGEETSSCPNGSCARPHNARRAEQQPLPSPSVRACAVAGRPVSVLLVEDSHIVRDRLLLLISDVPNVAVVGQAGEGFEAQAHFRQFQPDVVILDIQLPGINGMELLARFKKENPACIVIVLTSYAFKEFRQRCETLGADCFLDKTTEFDQIPGVLEAIQREPGF